MGILKHLRSRFRRNPFKKKGSVPKPEDPNDLARGKCLIVQNKKGQSVPVEVELVIGNIANPKLYEINSIYTISILEFYCQLEGRKPSDEEQAEWDSLELLEVVPVEGKKKKNGKKKNKTVH